MAPAPKATRILKSSWPKAWRGTPYVTRAVEAAILPRSTPIKSWGTIAALDEAQREVDMTAVEQMVII